MSVRFSVVLGRIEHAARLAPRLRRADLDEAFAVARLDGLTALAISFRRSSLAVTCMAGDIPVAMCGAAPENASGRSALPWLMASHDIENHAVAFLRQSRRHVRLMLAQHPMLHNWVDARHHAALHWLQWLGFRIDPRPEPYGDLGLPFHHFEMRRS